MREEILQTIKRSSLTDKVRTSLETKFPRNVPPVNQ